ncbi:MAG: hypothetical protein JW700_01000 [Candidatus Aenigmarchaeota archaeon]|nr:hypothetical protein [Candidatus Aenigmarchaeota archaeon]
MKLAKLVPVIMLLVLSVTAVMATHSTQTSFQPSEWSMGTEQDVTFGVVNGGGDNIVRVELTVPERNQIPLYKLLEFTTPQGWKYAYTTKDGNTPYKVIWTTEGNGISVSEMESFGVRAKSPSEQGEFTWSWKTVDVSGSENTGSITTKTGSAPLAYFKVTGSSSTDAGSSLGVTVTAYDSSDRIKTDYAGTITFSSSDPLATLAETYTFSGSDKGYKSFTVKLKTAGEQTITVSDVNSKLFATKTVKVEAGSIETLKIVADDLDAGLGQKVVFNAIASDIFGNQIDVTDDTSWEIDSEAKGTWTDNVYETENSGSWIVIGSYNGIRDGELLNVGGQVVVEPEVPEEEEEPEQEVPETPTAEITISGDEAITIPAGSNDTLVLTVNNNGDMDLTGVELGFEGVPSDWVLTFPLSSDIMAGSSKDYLVIIYVPDNETEARDITFSAVSDEGALAEKMVALSLVSPATGLLEAIPKNVLQLGVVIIAVAAVIIIGWELWFKK